MNRHEHTAPFPVAGTEFHNATLRGLIPMNRHEHTAPFPVADTNIHNDTLRGVETHD